MPTVAHSSDDATIYTDDPPTEELVRSIRADVEALHAIVRELAPMARQEAKADAIELANQAVSRFADAMLYLRRLEG